jgi:hypothetical protein
VIAHSLTPITRDESISGKSQRISWRRLWSGNARVCAASGGRPTHGRWAKSSRLPKLALVPCGIRGRSSHLALQLSRISSSGSGCSTSSARRGARLPMYREPERGGWHRVEVEDGAVQCFYPGCGAVNETAEVG